MKNLRGLVAFGCLTAIVSLAAPATAQQTPESQYDFLIGDWDVAVTLRRPTEGDLKYTAKWHNRWLAEGRLLLQEWKGPYAHGFELRSYSRQDSKWHGKNIYLPDPGEWYDNTAELVAGEMIVTTRRKTPDGGEFFTREIYHDIESDQFAIRSEISSDGGKTWRPGGYEAKMTRSPRRAPE